MKLKMLGLLLIVPAVAHAQSSSFVVLMGRDTIAVERFTHTADRLEGELTTRGMGPRLKYTEELANGLPQVLRNAAYSGNADSTLFQSAVLTFKGDSVIADITSKGMTITQRIGSQAGAFPFINPSFSLFEPVLARARSLGGATATIPLFIVSGGQTFPVNITWLGADSALISIGGVEMRLHTNARGEILGATVPSQNLTIIRSGAHARLEMPPVDYSAPANAPYTAENVAITGPAGTLAGTLTMPRMHKARVPVVVTISGSGLQERDESLPMVTGYRPFRQIAEALAARGVAVLRYDDRGMGSSTGNPRGATSADFAQDTRAVLAYLKTRSDVDTTNLFLLGHSEGGMIAPMIASTDRGLRGIVLMAGPAQTGREILAYQNRYTIDAQPNLTAAQRDSLYKVAVASLDSTGVQQPWIRYFLDYDPLATARQVSVPVLIMQGATDRQITADQANVLAQAFRAGGNRDVTVHVLPGVNHLFLSDPDGNPVRYTSLPDRKVVPQAIDLMSEWIVKHLK